MAVAAGNAAAEAVVGGKDVIIDQVGARGHGAAPASGIFRPPGFRPERFIGLPLPYRCERIPHDRPEITCIYLNLLSKNFASIGVP